MSGLKDIAPEIDDEEEDSQTDTVVDIEEAKDQMRNEEQMSRDDEKIREDLMRQLKLVEQ